VPVGVDRRLDVGVAEVLHDLVHLRAVRDEKRHTGVPEVVEAQPVSTDGAVVTDDLDDRQ
jgi:hypothetical protein